MFRRKLVYPPHEIQEFKPQEIGSQVNVTPLVAPDDRPGWYRSRDIFGNWGWHLGLNDEEFEALAPTQVRWPYLKVGDRKFGPELTKIYTDMCGVRLRKQIVDYIDYVAQGILMTFYVLVGAGAIGLLLVGCILPLMHIYVWKM